MAQIAVEILQLVNAAADVFPPLKSAAGGALYITKMVQKFKSNKKEWAQFAQDINNRLACVVKLLPEDTRTDTRNDLLDHVAHLETTLKTIESSIKVIQDQKTLKRIGSFARDPDRIKDMQRQFDDAIERFHFAITLTTGMDVANILGKESVQVVVERALDKFRAAIVSGVAPVVMENDMRSAVRDAFPLVKGASWDPDHACLSGTRTALLDEIMAWIRSADPKHGAEIFMISDVAGSGKTAIAHTVCQLVHKATDMHLLSSFFFARGIEGRDDFSRVLNHIIRDLAGLDRTIAREIGSIVEQNPSVAIASPSRQFAEIIMPLCRLYPADKPLVVVLDALDEACQEMDHPDGGFLGILSNKIHKLPGNFHLIITCRPEYKILQSLKEKEHIQKYSSPLSGSTAWDDIHLYINEQLKSVDILKDLPDNSPDLKLFLEKAEGLFNWVATVINFLKDCVEPYQQLKRLLEKSSSGNRPAEAKMESLYQTIFAECKWDDEDFQKGYSLFMGTIINLRTPLPMSAIEALHDCKSKGSMLRILRPVRSLLYGLDSDRDDEPVHILHLSLREFLTSIKHVSEPYFIHEVEHNQQLALCCVNTLNKELPNVSGLGFSTHYREEFNHAIVHLPQLGGVTQQLEYACQFWAGHLEYVNVQIIDISLTDVLVDFMTSKLISWLECVTVLDRFYPIYSWAQNYFPANHDLLCHIRKNTIAYSLQRISFLLEKLGRDVEALEAVEEAVQIRQVLAADRPEVFNKDLAQSLHSLSVNLNNFGRSTEALQAIQKAVELRRLLATNGSEVFKKDLAWSLQGLSVNLNNFGHHSEALKAIEEAVELRRMLAADRPQLYNKDLAQSLHSLSLNLNNFGRGTEALQAIQEAVELRRVLAVKKPQVFNKNLALSLQGLAANLNKFGHHSEALQAIEQAVGIWSVLAADRPQIFTKDLAYALHNLSLNLNNFDRDAEALQAIKQAVELRRVLAADRPQVFNKDLAQSLHTLAADLSNFGQKTEALQVIEEAIELRRVLAADRPQVFNKDLAYSLHNLSLTLSNFDRDAEALQAIEQAVELRRMLAADRPQVFNKDLAQSLHNLSVNLRNSGRGAEALQASKEAIELRRVLAADKPQIFNQYLAQSLHTFSEISHKFGHNAQAFQTIKEAVELRRVLAADKPQVFNKDLAESLQGLSVNLNIFGHQLEAIKAIEQAVGIWRILAADRPQVFNKDLAWSLHTLSENFYNFGRNAEALQAIKEAVELRRVLAADRPQMFNKDLADSLQAFSVNLNKFGHYSEALQAIEPAVGIWRVFAADRPQVFNKNLAISLHNLSITLSNFGDHSRTFSAIEEAIELWKNIDTQNPLQYKSNLQAATDWLKECQIKIGNKN